MSDNSPDMSVERLLAYLHEEFGDDVRSCVSYTPNSSHIHYLRSDIERDRAQAEVRLVRIKELYHAERLSATPMVDDSELGRLHVSYHLFDGALVVHFVEPAGRVIGISVESDTDLSLHTVSARCLEALYGTVPDGLSRS